MFFYLAAAYDNPDDWFTLSDCGAFGLPITVSKELQTLFSQVSLFINLEFSNQLDKSS